MKVADALAGIARLFIDTSPIIYYVEEHPRYIDIVASIFTAIDDGLLIAVTSPITLAESLVVPYRLGSTVLVQRYIDCIVYGQNTDFVAIDEHVASQAAVLRARYLLRLPDALQVAAAQLAGCDALLTNDPAFRRIAELPVLLVDELEP